MPKAVVVARMMSGLTARREASSSPMACRARGGRLATTTSAVPTSARTISRPSPHMGSRVRERLLRAICRYRAPSPFSPTGSTPRSSPPSRRSMRITSAPMSASMAAQYGPAIYRPKSSTRTPFSNPFMPAHPGDGVRERPAASGRPGQWPSTYPSPPRVETLFRRWSGFPHLPRPPPRLPCLPLPAPRAGAHTPRPRSGICMEHGMDAVKLQSAGKRPGAPEGSACAAWPRRRPFRTSTTLR